MRAIGPFCLLTLCLPLLLGAEVYRWVDKDGVVNYTQVKPRGVEAEQLQTRSSGPINASDAGSQPAATATPGPTEAQQRLRRELEQDEQARLQDMAQIKQENCTQARGTLDKLTIRNRVTETDESGERRVLPEEERQARIKQAQDAIVDNCTS